MKRLTFIIWAVLSFQLAFAQGEGIVIKAKTQIYKTDYTYRQGQERTVRNLEELKTKKIKKATPATVIEYTNYQRGLYYDTYVVQIGKQTYYVKADDVEDNTAINTKNESLQKRYDALANRISECDSLVKVAYDSIIARVDQEIFKLEPFVQPYVYNKEEMVNSYINKYISDDIAAKDEIRERYSAWVKTLPSSVQNDAQRLAIVWDYIEGGYFGVCDYTMRFVNMSAKKTIKYLYWTGRVKNYVGDYISSTIKGASSCSGRYAGYCYPYNGDSATWEGVIVNSEADYMVLQSVKLVYTDGSSYTIGRKSLDYISNIPEEVLSRWTESVVSSFANMTEEEMKTDIVINGLKERYRKKCKEDYEKYNGDLSIWRQLRREAVAGGLNNRNVYFLMQRSEYRSVGARLYLEDYIKQYDQNRYASDKAKEALNEFRTKNLIW